MAGETKRLITLPQGGTLEVDIRPGFLERVAQHYQIALDEVDDDHIRLFIWGAVDSAVSKEECKIPPSDGTLDR